MLEGKKIAIGVTGGIACYKVVTLVSRLVQAGAEVRVVMSEAATKLVSPLLFKEISGAPVAYDMWRGNDEFNVEHVALGRWCDLMVVAPATANIIGKMAGGIADDLLSTTLMACDKPKIICPAMNTNMLNNPAVVRNLETLRRDGILIMPSGAGYLACGINGAGRLPEPEDIKAYLDDFFAKRDGDLRGRRILVTAGGTREAIDPVRFIGNRSSGKMGYAIACDAARRGADVILVSECYNKCDLVADDEIPRGQDKVAISAASGFGLDALKEAVEQLLGRGKHHVKLLLPYAVGGMVAALHDTAQVLSSSYTENGIELDAIVDETLFGRLRQYVTEEV